MFMAKAESVKLRCETCQASFYAKSTSKAKFCAAHRARAVDKVSTPPGSSATNWVPYAKLKLADRVEQWLFAHDAANECVHGALPHDTKLPKGCKCWGVRMPFEEKLAVAKPKKKRDRKAA